MTRAETNVHMAMLFDNSGSLDFARDLKRKRPCDFPSRHAPIDEAAIYSVETESYLAQPLTKDVARLEQTIASFGKLKEALRSWTRLSMPEVICVPLPAGAFW